MNHQTVHNSRNVPKLSRRWFKRKVQFSVLWSPRFAIRSSAIEQEGKVWPSQQGLHQPQSERGTSLDRDSLFVGKLSGGRTTPRGRDKAREFIISGSFKAGKGEEIRVTRGWKTKDSLSPVRLFGTNKISGEADVRLHKWDARGNDRPVSRE